MFWKKRDDEKDNRPLALGCVGFIGLSLFALCIPLAALIAGHVPGQLVLALPFATIAGTAVALIVVWLAPTRKNVMRDLHEIRAEMAAMEGRLSNLEMITAFEQRRTARADAPTPEDTESTQHFGSTTRSMGSCEDEQ